MMDEQTGVTPDDNTIPDIETAEAGAPAPMSVYESVEAAFKEMSAPADADKEGQTPEKGDDAAEAKGDADAKDAVDADDDKEKGEAEEKPAEKVVKQTKPPAENEQNASVAKEPQESKPKVEAPEGFSQQAKDQWRNVPHPVRAEVQRITDEASRQIAVYKESAEHFERLRPYHDMAKSVDRDLADVIGNYVRSEQTLSQNPLKGLNDIIRNYLPPKADGTPMTLLDVANYVNHIGPQGLNQTLTQAQAQERQMMQQAQEQQAAQARDQEVETLRQQLIYETITAPFAAENEHYQNPQVQDHIAKILQSGILDDIQRPQDRLSEAYAMAVLRLGLQSANKASKSGSVKGGVEQARAGNFGGESPQVKSSLGSPSADRRQGKSGLSIRDSIAEAMNEVRNH